MANSIKLPVGRLIKFKRIELNLSMYDIERKSGLCRQYLYRVENEVVTPQLENFCKIAEALGVEPHSLLKSVLKLKERILSVR